MNIFPPTPHSPLPISPIQIANQNAIQEDQSNEANAHRHNCGLRDWPILQYPKILIIKFPQLSPTFDIIPLIPLFCWFSSNVRNRRGCVNSEMSPRALIALICRLYPWRIWRSRKTICFKNIPSPPYISHLISIHFVSCSLCSAHFRTYPDKSIRTFGPIPRRIRASRKLRPTNLWYLQFPIRLAIRGQSEGQWKWRFEQCRVDSGEGKLFRKNFLNENLRWLGTCIGAYSPFPQGPKCSRNSENENHFKFNLLFPDLESRMIQLSVKESIFGCVMVDHVAFALDAPSEFSIRNGRGTASLNSKIVWIWWKWPTEEWPFPQLGRRHD